jgi:4-amino-4-deoxy-L-arabinose transferase-like glycosyltransferase
MPALPENPRFKGIPLPPRGWALAILLALYLLPGLLGHDPWKVDDAAAFGVINDLLVRGHWLAPQLAGQPVFHSPLYYWVAAALGQLIAWPTAGLLQLHEAVRLTSAGFALLILGFVHLAARALHGRAYAVSAPLILAGSIGFLIHSHEMQPMLVPLAAHAGAYWALAMLDRRPWAAGAAFGAALGLGMLGGGLAPMVLLLPVAVAAFVLSREKKKTGPALLAGLALAAALLGLWLLPLAAAEPAYFAGWWTAELAQFGSPRQPLQNALGYLNQLPWYALPALPLAAWTLWSKRRQLFTPALALPLAGFVLLWLGLCVTFDARSVPALLLLPPLALLAVPGVASLRRGAANGLDWFAMITFSLFAALLCVGWSAMVFGWPASLARQALRLEPGFVGSFSLGPFILAVAGIAAWIWLIVTSARSPFRGMAHWAAGVTLFWLLACTLWMPWIDYGKTYRPLAAAIARQLPATHGCIAGNQIGEAQRASLDYFAGITTVSKNSAAGRRCQWLLTQGSARRDEASPGETWQKVWEGTRPGDRNEKFRLYRREAAAGEAAGSSAAAVDSADVGR